MGTCNGEVFIGGLSRLLSQCLFFSKQETRQQAQPNPVPVVPTVAVHCLSPINKTTEGH